MLSKVIYIGNFHRAAEYVYHAGNTELCAVVSEAGRVSDELFTFCILRAVPLFTVSSAGGIAGILEQHGVDYAVMCSFGLRLPAGLAGAFDIFNIHYGALPDYKGRHPTYHAMLNDEKMLGITLHRVNAEIDAGDIISRQLVSNYFWRNEQQLFDALTEQIPALLDALAGHLRGERSVIANGPGSYFPPVDAAQASIDLERDSLQVIFNKVRAQYRYGGCPLVLEDGVEVRVRSLLFTDPGQVDFDGAWHHDREQGLLLIRKAGVIIRVTEFTAIKGLS